MGKRVLLDDYVEMGWRIVAVGFKPFIPNLSTMSEHDQAVVQKEFYARATAIGKSMMNAEGMVEDQHKKLWVTASASKV